MKSARSNLSLAVAAGGILTFAVLASGVWLPKFPAGGLTQVGRTASVTFEDGTVMNLTESETDLDILKRRRMKGWNGHEFKQIFIMADGEEIEVGEDLSRLTEESVELNAHDHLLLAANTTDAPEELTLDSKHSKAVLANLQLDGKVRVAKEDRDGKDSVITDFVDGKDRVFIDPKDAKDAVEQPVFALTADQSIQPDERFDVILMSGGMGGGSDWGSMRTPMGMGLTGLGNGGSVSAPPIGTAVPEPGVLSWLGVTGALGLAFRAWRRSRVAA